MDFHSLSRRELQALCKKNKIPANVTNVAMADSLKSLEIVEGTDEVFQTCQSGMARLSIKPRGSLEAASPFQPPTGGRSKGQTSSACRKMDSLLKECAQEEKTPVPSGVSSRRRRAATEYSAVQGTRRSARLAEKSAKLLKENGKKIPDISMILIEGPDGLDEISGVTDVSESTNSEENSVMQDEEHADSAGKQDMATDVELVPTIGGAKPEFNESMDVEIKEKEVGSHNLNSPVVDAASIVEENPEKQVEVELGLSNEGGDVKTKDREVGSNNLDLAGIDAVTIIEENPETEIQSEGSCEIQVVFSVDEVELEPSSEGEDAETKDGEVDSNNLDLAGIDEVTIVEENLGTEIQSDCSAEKQVTSTAKEVELVPSNEAEMCDSERDGANIERKESIVVKIEQVTFGSKIAAELDDHNDAQETDGSDAIEMSENVVENDPSDQYSDPEDGAIDEWEGSEAIEMSEIVAENDPSNQDSDPEDEVVDECEADLDEDYSEMEFNPDQSDPVNSGPMEESTKTDLHEDSSEMESNSDESDSVNSDPTEESTKSNDSLAVTPADIGLMSDVVDADNCDVILEEDEKILVNDKHIDIEQSSKQVSLETVLEDAKEDAPEQIEIIQPEEFTAAVLHEDSSETDSNPDESDSVYSEPIEESTKSNDSLDVMPSDLGLMSDVDDAVNCDSVAVMPSDPGLMSDVDDDDDVNYEDAKILVKDIQLGFEQSAEQVSPGTVLEDAKADAPEQTEIVQPEENGVPLLGAPSYEEAVDGLNLQNSTQQLAGVGDGVPSAVAPECITSSLVKNEAAPQASLIIPPTKTPVRASAIKKRMLVPPSDNKENIVSGSKTTRRKERSKVVKETVLMLDDDDDDDQTIRQLLLKIEKLEITKKLDKSKGENEVSARPPLQAISRNQ